jgi:WD40 repeat protein/transcriptional regulator with XRE-family HTH domain
MYRDRSYRFGKLLLALRTRAALTQAALAATIGVHQRSVQNWEAGVSYPKPETLQRVIATFLRLGALVPGNELAEAQELWAQAVRNGARALPEFDAAWFASLQTQVAPRPGDASGPAAAQAPTPPLIDWGEAMDVPALYGRDHELETVQRWIVEDRCRLVALVGIGGIGKSSLAITLARSLATQFDVLLFRSLQNGPSLADVLGRVIGVISDQHLAPPDQLADKIALLVQLFRERRCLLILDNFEAILQPGALSGTYRTGYAEYGALLRALSERDHKSCLVLTSREKPVELGQLEARTAPARSLALGGLDEQACARILSGRDIAGRPDDVRALVRLYDGNPLALHLVTEPIRELFGGSLDAFLAAGDAFFHGLSALMEQQCARTTPLEHAIIRWLAIERDLVPVGTLLAKLGEAVPRREVLVALESLRRRVQIERSPDQSAFTLQPAILEFVTEQMIGVVRQEIVGGQPTVLSSHALVQATAKEYLRRSQERLIATPLLEGLLRVCGDAAAVERRLLDLIAGWRAQPLAAQGYGPGNVVNLLRLLRGDLRGLDLNRLLLRQAYLQGVEAQDTSLAGAMLRDVVWTETFDAIQSIAASADGAYWATASRSGEVRVWEAGSQAPYRVWQAHDASTWTCDLAFGPDGRTLATASWDGTVRLWDVATAALLWLARHPSHIQRVAFAPDGGMIASCGGEKMAWVWQSQDGTQLHTLPHPHAVTGLGWSPDGRLLATGDRAGEVRLWRLSATTSPECLHTLQGHTNAVNSLAFAPNGATLASASWDGTVKLWDVRGARLGQTLAGYPGRVTRVAWSPDGQVVAASGSEPTIWLWDAERDEYRAALRGHSAGVASLAFMADSRGLLSGSEDGTLRVWDIASEQSVRTIAGYATLLYDLDWSPEGAYLVSAGADGVVARWDASGATPPQALHKHGGSVFGVSWSPDGRWVASSEWNTAITLLGPQPGAQPSALRHPDDIGSTLYGLAWSPDGRRLASGTFRRGAYVFELTGRGQRWAENRLPTWIRQVSWRPDGARLAGGGDDGTLYIWDAEDGALCLRLVGHQRMITSLAWSPDGARLASSGSGGELFVWDAGRGEQAQRLEGHAGAIYAVGWVAGDEELLISGGGDGALRWWDVRSGACVRVRQAYRGAIQSLRASPDGTQLATCGDDGAIMLWDVRSGEHRRTLRRDRPYERLTIAGAQGLSEAQRATLRALGATEEAPA